MLIKDLKFDRQLTLLPQSHLWARPVSAVKPADLLVFLRQHWGTPNYTAAMSQAQALVDAAWDATLHTELPPPPIIYFELPQPRLTLDELTAWLSCVSVARRRAILFALETETPIADVICLTWKNLKHTKNLTPFAYELARAGIRHIRLDYVFWEDMPSRIGAGPLFGLEESAFEVSQGMGFAALQRLYKTVIPIDCASDLDHFADALDA